MIPTQIVFLSLIFQCVVMFVYACLEQHQNNSYLGFVIIFSVAAIITSLLLMRMMDDD